MQLQFITRYLDSANPSPGPTLADLDNPDYVAPTDIKGGDGTKTPADLAKEAADKQAADEAAATLLADAKNEDGTLKPGFIEVDGKVQKDPNYVAPAEEEIEETDEEYSARIIEETRKLHGWDEMDIKYPEGVNPLSPAGLHHRDRIVMQSAADNFENFLRSTYPRAYALMLHNKAGLPEEEFFSKKSLSLPEYESFKESVDLQTTMYKSSLTRSGLDEELAQAQVDKAIKDGKLFEKSDAIYKKTEKEQQQQLAEIERKGQVAEAEFSKAANVTAQSIAVVVNENKLGIIIPDSDKKAFIAYVQERLEYDSAGKRFLLTEPIDLNDHRQMEAMFYKYKKGNLKEFIAREAQSSNVRRLKSAITKTKETSTGGTGGNNTQSQPFVPFGQV